MAFMAMRKNLDERARKKELDAIFKKFDRNQNGELWDRNADKHLLDAGMIFIRDFISELRDQEHHVSEEEVGRLQELADCDGQV